MKTQQGFTLIELAIVLVIVTILLSGLAMPLAAQIEARRIAETRKTIQEAREALIGYAMTHTTTSCLCSYTAGGLDAAPATTCVTNLCPTSVSGTGTAVLTINPRHYLPCPDMDGDDPQQNVDNDGVQGLTDINNGVEDRYASGACTASSGHLPWVTLATADQDAWGNRINYALTTSYAHSASGFNNSSTGDLQVCGTSTGGCAFGTVASNVPVVLVSYGPNGWGGRNVNNTTLALPTSADEIDNINSNLAYVTRSPSKPGTTLGEFDDLVVWLADSLLKSRVCPSGGCP